MWDSDGLHEHGFGPAPVEEALAEGTVEVLETMFFEIPQEEVECGEPPRKGPGSVADFTGSRNGTLLVRLDGPAAVRLAASFLGREDDSTVTQEETGLVLMELANMVCGNALSRIEPRGAFQIAAPRPICEDDEAEAEGWLVAPLESGRLAVRLSFTDCE